MTRETPLFFLSTGFALGMTFCFIISLAIGNQSKENYVCILKEQKGWVYTNNAEDCGAIKNVLNNIENI